MAGKRKTDMIYHIDSAKLRAVGAAVWKHYKNHGRHALPWREDHDPYRVLVSEVMLQQTQVERVIPYFTAWLAAFPEVRVLAKAPLGNVLRLWQGLGYNRRAKLLHETAKAVVKEHGGRFPKTREALERLPGIGPYTAGAVAAFAFNEDGVFVETNIRTAVTHHFFANKVQVGDEEVREVLARVLPKGRAREWYAALMDYGSFLKRSGVRLNARAKGYAKQKKFAGSDREARGAILKALVRGPKEGKLLIDLFGAARRPQMRSALANLVKEGMVAHARGRFRLPR